MGLEVSHDLSLSRIWKRSLQERRLRVWTHHSMTCVQHWWQVPATAYLSVCLTSTSGTPSSCVCSCSRKRRNKTLKVPHWCRADIVSKFGHPPCIFLSNLCCRFHFFMC